MKRKECWNISAEAYRNLLPVCRNIKYYLTDFIYSAALTPDILPEVAAKEYAEPEAQRVYVLPY
jgi:hypothetical protein